MQPDYIYCKYNIYIAFDNSNNYYLSFGIKFESLSLCSVQSGETGGVSFWNVRETGGQEGHFGPVSVKPQHSDFSRKTVFSC